MSIFFNEAGILDIDELVESNESFKKIMADGEVTEEEVIAQADKVVSLMHDMEARFTPEQLTEVKSLLAETSVLYAVYNYYSIMNINK